MCPERLYLLLEAALALLTPLQELCLLHLSALVEEGLDFLSVSVAQLNALVLKGHLNLIQLLVVVPSQGVVLLAHLPYQRRDVLALPFEHLDVFLVFVLQLRLEVPDPAILGVGDLLAGVLLKLQLLVELLWDVHVEEVRPLHLDGRVLTAAGHGLDLQGLIAVEAVVLLDDPSLILLLVEAHADVGDLVPGLRSYALQHGGRDPDPLLASRHLLLHLILLCLLALRLLLLLPELLLCPLPPGFDAFLLAQETRNLQRRHHTVRGSASNGSTSKAKSHRACGGL
mmetsp:Transcript_11515/g.26220  ORF Transcript_11515/g.26220 Transcript_11515/m.26220 type:complete len:284 (-) Transcript_11515:38-889(-)